MFIEIRTLPPVLVVLKAGEILKCAPNERGSIGAGLPSVRCLQIKTHSSSAQAVRSESCLAAEMLGKIL
jgi:hypothetical protein